MTAAKLFLITLMYILAYSFTTMAQKVIISGEGVVGMPGEGNSLLTFNTERSWIFRQYGTGSGTALELYSTVGQKNFIITTTGNLGIDVPAPTEKLHVNGSIKATGPKISFGSNEYFNDAGSYLIECNGTLRSVLDNSDNLGSSTRRWNSVYAVNGTINTSDLRSKTNIQPIAYGLNTLMQLRPVSFQWIDALVPGNKLGLIAQEVQKFIPEVVVDYDLQRDEATGQLVKKPAKQLGMYYADLIPVLIKATQEQQQLIKAKDEKIAQLEEKSKDIEARLLKLEQLIEATALPATVPGG